MIDIKINIKDKQKSIAITGHAEYDEHGKDIVCASVSTIFQLAIMGLSALAEQFPNHIKITEVYNEKQD